MAGELISTVIGNLTSDPELRFVPSGSAVANFTIAQTPRSFDRKTNEWKDEETLFVRCSIWREAAEQVVESLTKGTRVVAYGRLKARSYETTDGQKRTNWELEVDEIGPSLKYATAKVTKANKSGGNNNSGFNTAPASNGGQGDPWGGGGQSDPTPNWGTPTGPENEPPF